MQSWWFCDFSESVVFLDLADHGHSDEFDNYGEYGKTDDLDDSREYGDSELGEFGCVWWFSWIGDSVDSVDFGHCGVFGKSGGLMQRSSGRIKYIGDDFVGFHIIILTQNISLVVCSWNRLIDTVLENSEVF